MAIEGDTVVVGAYRDDDGGADSGSVYVFRTSNSGASYNEVAKLKAHNAAENDLFGYSVAISAGMIAIGAMGDAEGGGWGAGSVYLFHTEDDGATWSEFAFLIASDAAADAYFGWSVAISGVRVIAGAYKEDGAGGDSGAAYLFEMPATPEPTTAAPTPRPTINNVMIDSNIRTAVTAWLADATAAEATYGHIST